MKYLRKSVAMLLSLCVLLCGLGVNFTALAAEEVNVRFNSMDSAVRQDMEPSQDTAVKDLATHTADYLEGTGAVKFGYKAKRTDLAWYGRVPELYNTTGISIAGLSHMIFDLYVSDVSKWSLNENCNLNLRSLKSAQTSGTWDTSCGQVKAADLYAAFSNLKNGWNHVVLPLDTSVATETMIWGFQIRFPTSTAQAGFYLLMDDVRFVNQAYLDGANYQNALANKPVTRVKALMAAIPSITNAAEQRRMKVAANITYHSLDAARKAQANSGVPYDNEQWKDNGVPASYLTNRKAVNPGDYAFSLAVVPDLHYAVRNYAAWNDVYLNAMNWIVANREKENIKMAVQLGDLTSNVDYNDGRNETCEWDAVRGGFDILRKNNVPFATVPGNHDRVGGYTNYNTYFPYAEQAQSPYFGGAMQEGQTQNLYYTFQVGGVKYMVLTLDVYPSDSTIAWANSIVKSYSDHNVILVTHSYLLSQNTYEIIRTTEAEDPSYTGEELWNNLIKINPNIIMTLSAHNEYPRSKAGLGLMQSTNDAGKPVYQFLVGDPQPYDLQCGGLGSVIMLRFTEDGKKASLEYISTRYDKHFIGFTNESPLHTTNYYEVAVDSVTEPQTFDEYTESLAPVFHAGLSTATSADPDWNNYYYAAQQFLPGDDTIHGISLPLALTSQEATVHFEIRSELNGSALASKDVDIKTLGSPMIWYDLMLDTPLQVTPHERYYLVYYLTKRSAAGVCIVYGTNFAERAQYPGAVWRMAGGGDVSFNMSSGKLCVGFNIIDGNDMDQIAADEVKALIDALPQEITLEDKAQVEAARAAYNNLTEAQKGLVGQDTLAKLTAAEQTVADLEEEAAQAAADKAAADEVMALIDALPREITLEDKTQVEAARDAYDVLTEAQKALVTNLQKLTDAEAALAALEQPPVDPPVEPPVEPDLFYGDADGNGTVDAADALKALQHAVKLITLEGEDYTVADVDGNQNVDAADALLMLQYTVKLIDSFPVEE